MKNIHTLDFFQRRQRRQMISANYFSKVPSTFRSRDNFDYISLFQREAREIIKNKYVFQIS